MKRIKLYFAAATLCAAAAVGYNVYTNATMTEQERLVQANLEALSNREYGEIITCYSSAWGGYWYGYTCDPCGNKTKHNGDNKSSCLN